MRIDLIKILRVLAGIAIVLLWAWLLTSCKTCECFPSIEYRDSIVTRYYHDTIQTYEKDSVFIHARGDTVWRERWSIRWRDKIVERHDTIYQDRQTETVRVEKVVPTFYRTCTRGFWLILLILIVGAVVRILVRVYLKK